MRRVREALGHLSELRGDGLDLGWRSVVGVVLVTVLFLHGFDSSFVVDGYTLGVLGLLLVVALAGELESARVAGVSLQFRKLALQQVERSIADSLRDDEERPEDENGEGEAGPGVRPEGPRSPSGDRGIIVPADSTGAVLSFFNEVERAINSLYAPLRQRELDSPSLAQKVDQLARYGVVPVAEGRAVLELFALRNAYAHGRPVDSEEATRLLAVGGRLLPSLTGARRALGRAFEEQVGEILESIPSLVFARQQTLDLDKGAQGVLRPDFLVLAPVQIVIEAVFVSDGPTLAKRRPGLESRYADTGVEAVVAVVPPTAFKAISDRRDDGRVVWIVVDDLKGWVEERIADA